YYDGPDAGTAPEWQRRPGVGDWVPVEIPDNSTDSMIYNLYGSGPIIKDKLFFYALAQGESTEIESYGNSDQAVTKSDSPQYYVKLDWNINQNHYLEATAFRDKVEEKERSWFSTTPYETGKGAEKLSNA